MRLNKCTIMMTASEGRHGHENQSPGGALAAGVAVPFAPFGPGPGREPRPAGGLRPLCDPGGHRPCFGQQCDADGHRAFRRRHEPGNSHHPPQRRGLPGGTGGADSGCLLPGGGGGCELFLHQHPRHMGAGAGQRGHDAAFVRRPAGGRRDRPSPAGDV